MPLLVDCFYSRPEFAGAYLLQEDQEGLFIENNTVHALGFLLEALSKRGLTPHQVKFLIVTHIHLDHAGGSSALMKACPNAVLLAHPKAAPHLVDPTKLVKSAKQVYGEKAFQELYGTIEPIDASRVRVMQDGEQLLWGSRKLTFIHTRGHANHHFCVFDSASEGVFTGDSFGLAYPALQKRGLFIFPSTSPTDFDPGLARQSIQKIRNLNPKHVYLTHYGAVEKVHEAAQQLLMHLDRVEALLEQAVGSSLKDEQLDAYCEKELQFYFSKELDLRGLGSDPFVWQLIQNDLKLNASGIAHVARKRRKGAS